MKLKTKTLNRGIFLAAMAILYSGEIFSQTMPASSGDSGRRAIIAINQSDIYNNINAAKNTANFAVAVGSEARNLANSANAAANYGIDQSRYAFEYARAINISNCMHAAGGATPFTLIVCTNAADTSWPRR